MRAIETLSEQLMVAHRINAHNLIQVNLKRFKQETEWLKFRTLSQFFKLSDLLEERISIPVKDLNTCKNEYNYGMAQNSTLKTRPRPLTYPIPPKFM